MKDILNKSSPGRYALKVSLGWYILLR